LRAQNEAVGFLGSELAGWLILLALWWRALCLTLRRIALIALVVRLVLPGILLNVLGAGVDCNRDRTPVASCA
jgi:hypothetical protein